MFCTLQALLFAMALAVFATAPQLCGTGKQILRGFLRHPLALYRYKMGYCFRTDILRTRIKCAGLHMLC